LHFAAETGNAIFGQSSSDILTYDGFSGIALAAGRGYQEMSYRLFEADAAEDWCLHVLSPKNSTLQYVKI
jgi:hypothetical protein